MEALAGNSAMLPAFGGFPGTPSSSRPPRRLCFHRAPRYTPDPMLQRHRSVHGPVFHFSPLLGSIGTPHAFSTRQGGLSGPPFDSLNLGNPSGCAIQDASTTITANYELLLEAMNCPRRQRCSVHQVHGGGVIDVPTDAPFEYDRQADALISNDPARLMAVRIADCVPVLLASDDGRCVGAVHAGWRGIIGDVIPAAIEHLRAMAHCEAARIVAAIGPCIGFDAFEVGLEVVEKFQRRFVTSPPVRQCADGKGRVNLRAAAALQLMEAGVPQSQIDTTDRCTFTHGDEFFSHRRDRGVSGRMAALIGPRDGQWNFP
jgi:hypothetical protein